MWTKLREYYSESKPYAYGDVIILHPSMKTKWFRQHEWDPRITEQYIESIQSRFNQDYTTSDLKRSYSEIDDDSDSSGQEENEFSLYTKYKRVPRIDNPLTWWRESGGLFPFLRRMARDTFAVPATGSGVEREFSISGNIVSARRNRLSPKTISDLMQFKRWATRTGKVAEFLQNRQNLPIVPQDEYESDPESIAASEDEEINPNLIAWLTEWQTREDLRVRGKFLEPTA